MNQQTKLFTLLGILSLLIFPTLSHAQRNLIQGGRALQAVGKTPELSRAVEQAVAVRNLQRGIIGARLMTGTQAPMMPPYNTSASWQCGLKLLQGNVRELIGGYKYGREIAYEQNMDIEDERAASDIENTAAQLVLHPQALVGYFRALGATPDDILVGVLRPKEMFLADWLEFQRMPEVAKLTDLLVNVYGAKPLEAPVK